MILINFNITEERNKLMEYPIEKYKIIRNGNAVMAFSTYAGRTVKGVANCSPEDNFSLEKGTELAAARCAVKVAKKRVKRALNKLQKANEANAAAQKYLQSMTRYFLDSMSAQDKAEENLKKLLRRI